MQHEDWPRAFDLLAEFPVPAVVDGILGRLAATTDPEIAKVIAEHRRWRRTLNEIIAKHTGQDYEKVKKDSERDYFMSAEEARQYGIIDEVVVKQGVPVANKT